MACEILIGGCRTCQARCIQLQTVDAILIYWNCIRFVKNDAAWLDCVGMTSKWPSELAHCVLFIKKYGVVRV